MTASTSDSRGCRGLRHGFPEAPFPGAHIYGVLGEVTIRRMVTRQHELLWGSPSGHLFGENEAHFRLAVERTADYFVEMLGGPKRYTPVQGNPRLGKRHRPFAIGPEDRETWLHCLARAMREEAVPGEVAEEIWAWVEPLSMRMLSPRRSVEELRRISLLDAFAPLGKNTGHARKSRRGSNVF